MFGDAIRNVANLMFSARSLIVMVPVGVCSCSFFCLIWICFSVSWFVCSSDFSSFIISFVRLFSSSSFFSVFLMKNGMVFLLI